jgi:CRP-like cAMP-binding protein
MKKEQKQTEVLLEFLEDGAFFGEVALFSNLKRTASVRAYDYCTFSQLDGTCVKTMKLDFPSVYLSFRQEIFKYSD